MTGRDGSLWAAESGSEQAQLNFEIPFRNNDQQEVLQLKIREQFKDEEAQKGNKIWTVNMAFHLPSLGGIRIYITLDKEDLAIQFWTEEKNCQQLLQQFFPLIYFIVFNIYVRCDALSLMVFSTVMPTPERLPLPLFFSSAPVFAHNSSVELKTTVIQPAS